jgi:putative FmdB family regulatory protein
MPNYDFACSACGHKFEAQIPIARLSQDVRCPHCCEPAQRQISPVGFRLKGAGFYQNDYARKKQTDK